MGKGIPLPLVNSVCVCCTEGFAALCWRKRLLPELFPYFGKVGAIRARDLSHTPCSHSSLCAHRRSPRSKGRKYPPVCQKGLAGGEMCK